MPSEPLTYENALDNEPCWECGEAASSSLHDETKHDDCDAHCRHHSYQFMPELRQEIYGLMTVAALLRAELDRLAGPVCPTDGKRASEHSIETWPDSTRHIVMDAKDFKHPWVEEVAQWLRERGK